MLSYATTFTDPTNLHRTMATLPRPRFSTLVLLAGLLMLAACYAAWVWTDTLTDLGGDSGAYLIISRLYSPYHAASAATLAYKSGIVSPPLFPFMLALVDGGYHMLAAHLLVAAFGAASVAAVYFWLRREAFNWPIAALMALLFAILPATLMMLFNIWTEFPYLFFSMAAIALLAPSTSEPTRKAWLAAAVMVACATLIRVAALPLLAAFLLYLVLRRPRRWIVLGVVAALPFAIWALYSGTQETGAGNYVGQFVAGYTGDPIGKLIRQFGVEYDAVFNAWKSGWMQYGTTEVISRIVTGFWYVCIAGWLYRLARLKFDALYCLAYLAELFLWPHAEEAMRYSYVIYPVFIGSGLLLAAAVPKRIAEPNGRPYLAATMIAVLVLAVFPAIRLDINLFNAPMPVELEAARHTQEWYQPNRFAARNDGLYKYRLFKHLGEVRRQVPAGDCIFAIKPTWVTLLTDHVSKGPPRTAADDAEFNRDIAACRYAYVIPFVSPTFSQASYPMARLGNRAKILSRIDDESGGLDAALLEITP